MERLSIILDTSAYSGFLRGQAELKPILAKADRIFLNPIILGELLAGFAMGKNGPANRAYLERFLASPRTGVVAVDGETSERYAAIIRYLHLQGTPIPTNDIWIAASAMQFGLKVVTRDAHFLKIPHILIEFIAS
jgi:tRNA(fMet)-specific endonuclease VapC